MNAKKITMLRAALLSPLVVGLEARLSCYGRTVCTPAVVAIHRVDPSAICFETRNMLYWLFPALLPQEAFQAAVMAAA